jgi:hypothetical protein
MVPGIVLDLMMTATRIYLDDSELYVPSMVIASDTLDSDNLGSCGLNSVGLGSGGLKSVELNPD